MNRRYSFALTLLILFAVPSIAQIIDVSPTSGRLLPRPAPQPPPPPPLAPEAIALQPPPPKPIWLVSPFYLRTDGAQVALITAAGIFPKELTGIPLRADVTYTYIDPDGSDHLDSYGASVRGTVWKRGDIDKLIVLGSYADTRDASSKTQAGMYGELTIGRTPFSAGADARWVRTTAGGGIDDIVTKVLASYNGKVTLSADYTFENHVDGESDYSAEIGFDVPHGGMGIGAGKNSTVYVYYYRLF